MKNKEHDLQAAFIDWCGWKQIKVFAIPNASKWFGKIPKTRTSSPFALLKWLEAEGLEKGVPDLFIPYVRKVGTQIKGGLFIEFKNEEGKASREQMDWLNFLSEEYLTVMVRTTEDAIGFTQHYLGIK
jgi:hypothetical protein